MYFGGYFGHLKGQGLYIRIGIWWGSLYVLEGGSVPIIFFMSCCGCCWCLVTVVVPSSSSGGGGGQ